MIIAVIATNAMGRFCRAGMGFTKDPRILRVKDLADGVLERLQAEVNLHVREATEAEIAALDAPDAPTIDDALHDELMRAIPELDAAAYGQDGLPKLADLRAAIPDADPKAITKEAVKAAFDALVKGGFQAPA